MPVDSVTISEKSRHQCDFFTPRYDGSSFRCLLNEDHKGPHENHRIAPGTQTVWSRSVFSESAKVQASAESNSTPTKSLDDANPKDLLGRAKVSFTKLPDVAVIHGSHAMMNGADRYGSYNWRTKKVIASIYIDAARRHLASWFAGQEAAEDSGVHHLGHAIACLAILLDAQATGNLVDDRPVSGQPNLVEDLLKKLQAQIQKRRADAVHPSGT